MTDAAKALTRTLRRHELVVERLRTRKDCPITLMEYEEEIEALKEMILMEGLGE